MRHLVAEDGELIARPRPRPGRRETPGCRGAVIVLDHLSEAQRRAYRIADNKLTELVDG